MEVKCIRERQGYLRELQGKNKLVTVGVLGVQSGAGATTMAVSLAGYLSGFLKQKTAVVECGQKSSFILMHNTEDVGHFSLKHIDYYCKGSLDMMSLGQLGYDMVVVDFGSGLSRIGDYMRCTHKIVVGTLEPWNVDRYENFCQELREYNGSDLWLHILHGDIAELRRIRRAFGVCALKRPDIENVHIIDRSLIQFFQTLF